MPLKFSLIPEEIKLLTKVEKWLVGFVFLLLLLLRLYVAHRTPLHVDEVYTFLHFTREGIFRSLSYYPEPNNHVFFSVITAIFYHISPDIYFSLRLPAFLISAAVTVYLFFTVKKYSGFWVALIGTSLFSFSHLALYYSFAARGYFLLTGFSILAAFSILQFVSIEKRQSLFYFSIAAVLGCFTVPVFIYPLFSVIAFGVLILLLNKRWNSLFWLFTAILISGMLVGLMYTPIFIVSGLSAVTANKFVTSIPGEVFYPGFLNTLKQYGNDITGKEYYGFLLPVFLISCYLSFIAFQLHKFGRACFKKPQTQFVLLLLCIYLVPILIIAVQRVFPAIRIWVYLSAFQFVGLGWLIVKLLGEDKIKKFGAVLFFVLILGYGSHQLRVYFQLLQYRIAIHNSITNAVKILSNNKPDKIFIQHFFYHVFAELAIVNDSLKSKVVWNEKILPPGKYNYFLVDINRPLPLGFDPLKFTEVYKDNFVKIYKK